MLYMGMGWDGMGWDGMEWDGIEMGWDVYCLLFHHLLYNVLGSLYL